MIIGLLTAIHVLSIILWIGGVCFVTLIIFPMIMRTEGSFEKVLFFQGVEHRFARIVKPVVAIAGITGFLLLYFTGEWKILFSIDGFSQTLMFLVWLVYVIILVLEAKLFKVIFKEKRDMNVVFNRMTVFHWVIMILSLLTVLIGVIFAHGGI